MDMTASNEHATSDESRGPAEPRSPDESRSPDETSDVVVVRTSGTGAPTWALGSLYEKLVSAGETGGQLGVSIVTQPPGMASPLHVHTREAEAWFILDGTMTYLAGGRLVDLAAGDFIYLPRDVPHGFRTTGSTPVRFLAMAIPGQLLDMYDQVGVPATERRIPDGGVPAADIARWGELGQHYGLRIVGPPIAEAVVGQERSH
jgi:mannose-6-phosphate isomerase-like protein (cupin superfamily)